MSRTLGHRGPDGQGLAVFRAGGGAPVLPGPGEAAPDGPGTALAHTRLAILDLSPAGHQPMATPDDRFWIVFNGEIYNYIELRRELEAAGERFASGSDTEVLLRAWALWGEGCLARLEGMFAFAVFDARERTLTLVRDFFGIKPLYWAAGPGWFAFGSEIRALLALPVVEPLADPVRVGEYLCVLPTDHGERTFYAQVRQLPAGHLLTVGEAEPGRPKVRAYFTPAPREARPRTLKDAGAELREIFLSGVARHMRSDVPVGVALSGGLDSSAVLAAMRQAAPGAQIGAFCYAARGSRVDESRYAGIAARAAGARLHEAVPEPGDFARDVDALLDALEEPAASMSQYAQYRVMALARERGVTVLLDGQGADELLGGYRPYAAARAASLIRSGRVGAGLGLLLAASRLPGPGLGVLGARLGKLLLPQWCEDAARALLRRPLAPPFARTGWLRDQGALPRPGRRYAGPDVLRQELADSLSRSFLPSLLRHEDRTSMAFSRESRLPFLTPAMWEFASTLPEELLVDGRGLGKPVLREAMRGLVPDEILARKDKIGFVVPEAEWLRGLGPWAGAVLAQAREAAPPCAPPCLDMDALARAWSAFEWGGAYDQRLLRGLLLARWALRGGVRFA